jgi:hypothetical protein
MADKKISQLSNASTPLAGTEVVPVVQSGSTVKVSISDLTAGRTVPVSGVSFAASANLPGMTSETLDDYEEGTYTPAWTASSVNPVLGNGTLLAKYVIVGGLCNIQISLTMGSTTTFGTGEWSFSLPIASAAASTGQVWALDSGTAYFIGICLVNAGVSTLTIFSNSAGSGWSPSQPFTWAANDQIELSLTYQV